MSAPNTRWRVYLLIGLVIFGVVAVTARGPIHQAQGYHAFADQRRLLGIPNF